MATEKKEIWSFTLQITKFHSILALPFSHPDFSSVLQHQMFSFPSDSSLSFQTVHTTVSKILPKPTHLSSLFLSDLSNVSSTTTLAGAIPEERSQLCHQHPGPTLHSGSQELELKDIE